MFEFKKGFFGGKFLPFHRGHRWCIREAAKRCEELYVILFINSDEEKLALQPPPKCGSEILAASYRKEAVQELLAEISNARLVVLDCNQIRKETKDSSLPEWEKEIPYIFNAVGSDFDVIFSSEAKYTAFFAEHYPWATHCILDQGRRHIPISGTELRAMQADDAEPWLLD